MPSGLLSHTSVDSQIIHRLIDLTEDEETVEDSVIEDEDDEAEVEEDEPTDLVRAVFDLIHIYSVSISISICI